MASYFLKVSSHCGVGETKWPHKTVRGKSDSLGVKYVRTGEDFYSNWLRFIGVGTFRSEFGSWEVSLKQFTRSK